MRQRKYRLDAKEVHSCASEVVNEHLGLEDFGPKCQASVLLHVLFYAAGRMCSLFAACAQLQRAPSDQALRNALVAQLPEIDELERRLQASLVAMLPNKLTKRRWRLAIDLTLIPYHGQPHSNKAEVYRGAAKSGTTHFHAYASCYLVVRGQRFTVALARVELGTPMQEVIRILLRRAKEAGIQPKDLLLDRGFYSVGVVRYLQAARIPFVMPMPMRGRKASHPKGASATRVFAGWKRSGWTKYTWTDANGQRATVSVCVHRCRQRQRRKKRTRTVTLVYACWGMGTPRTDSIRQTYRRRLGIETSYRQMNQGRIRTCTRRPDHRLLFVALALVLRNVWVWLHWMVLAERRRGGRRLQLEKLRLRTMLLWLQRLAESVLGTVGSVEAEFLE